MLPSPATECGTSKNVGPGPQLMSCEAQRDLVFARARQPLSQRQNQRNRPARPLKRNFETPHHVHRRDWLGGLVHEHYRAAA